MKDIAHCLPKHLQPRVKKQQSIETQLLSCLPEQYRQLCEVTIKDGDIILYVELAHQLMALRTFLATLQTQLYEIPKWRDATILMKVKPRH